MAISATDLYGRTLLITGKVPVYSSTTLKGQKKPKPAYYLKKGDYTFKIYSHISATSAYGASLDRDDSYYISEFINGKTYYIAFKDLAGKYDLKAVSQSESHAWDDGEDVIVDTSNVTVKEKQDESTSSDTTSFVKPALIVVGLALAYKLLKPLFYANNKN